MNHNRDESASRDVGTEAVPADSWRVLVVDDEPEVFAITRLVLGRMQFRTRPVVVEGVASAAEARNYLERHPDTAIVLLDLVMETDDAGLRLVRHIRERAGLRHLQILVRTGHPAVAPEADVIATYDINGYYLKTELTAQRLRSAITFALRNLEAAGFALASAAPKPGNLLGDETLRRATDEVLQAIEQPPMIEPRIHLATGHIAAYEVSIGPRSAITPEAFSHALALMPEAPRLAWDRRIVAMLPDLFSTLAKNAAATRLAFRMLSLGTGGDQALRMLEQELDRTGLPPSRLELCLPERELAGFSQRWSALRARGVALTLDGVGLGAMSLPDIQRLRPDIVALHPQIVCGVSDDVERAAIVRSVVALTHTLGAQSLARGVASNADIQFCKWEGCEYAQGPAVSSLAEDGASTPPTSLH